MEFVLKYKRGRGGNFYWSFGCDELRTYVHHVAKPTKRDMIRMKQFIYLFNNIGKDTNNEL